eukprot:TRINITY_DN527_c0_g1_i1.p1 TRINITY_DN527_c0_g1~~TRINITY_DN527_c0_g1_i1.p1  ORF type:complete len:143 (+),score=20.66 TRINITY_DN527_c0_g1_i1:379-807(+)
MSVWTDEERHDEKEDNKEEYNDGLVVGKVDHAAKAQPIITDPTKKITVDALIGKVPPAAIAGMLSLPVEVVESYVKYLEEQASGADEPDHLTLTDEDKKKVRHLSMQNSLDPESIASIMSKPADLIEEYVHEFKDSKKETVW